MNIETGALQPWDSLTPEQQKSGEWIKVPDGTEGGMARPASLLDRAFPKLDDEQAQAGLKRAFDFLAAQRGHFDATGKPRP
jgi:hypothetical protein